MAFILLPSQIIVNKIIRFPAVSGKVRKKDMDFPRMTAVSLYYFAGNLLVSGQKSGQKNMSTSRLPTGISVFNPVSEIFCLWSILWS